MSKYKIIALMGKAGSGKDTIMKEVLKVYPGLHEIVSCTTRPPREGEVHGKNYFFLTEEEFAAKVLNMEMFEATSFRDWFYGMSTDSLDETVINIGVFNPDGIDALLESPEVDLTVFYVHASDKTRLMRQLNREHNPDVEEIIRRYSTDKEDFNDLDFNYIDITNETHEDLIRAVMLIVRAIEDPGIFGQK